MNFSRSACFLITAALCIVLFSSSLLEGSGAKSIVVPRDYQDIQSAINAASDGDIITVMAGTYSGFKVTKTLTIFGESNSTVVIKGQIEIYANNSKVGSMKVVLERPSSGLDSAIKVLASNVLLESMVVESTASGIQLGDMDHGWASASVEHCSITAGRENLTPKPGGIWGACSMLGLYYSSVSVYNGSIGVGGCRSTQIMFSNIRSYDGTGVKMSSGELRNSTVSSATTAVLLTGRDAVVMGSRISGDIGIDIPAGSIANSVEKSEIAGASSGIRLTGSENILRENIISGGQFAVELRGSNNYIVLNVLSGGRGVNALNGYGNTIALNFINRTGHIGVYMSKSTGNNTIFGNVFWYCYNYCAADESGGNSWYIANETTKMGNYWYNHVSPDSNKDGIVDSPYAIATTTGKDILDLYPLASPPSQVLGVFSGTSTTTITTTTTTITSYTVTTATNTFPTKTTATGSEISSASTSAQGGGGYGNIVIASVAAVLLLSVMLLAVMRRRK
ncbi:MAG: NosD domain-containing protein [Fervidicoccaceae archaeon]